MNRLKLHLPQKNGRFRDIILLLPVIFSMAVIPLIVRITYYDPKLSSYSWFSSETHVMDMFMYYKNNAMILLDAVLAIFFVYLLLKKELPKLVAFGPLGIYFILVVLSSAASAAPQQTWHGFFGMLESAFALFGYCMICYYGFAVVKNEKLLRIIMFAFLTGVFILCLIGVSQFLGYDFYMSDIGKSLIFPSKYSGYKERLSLAFGKGRVYTSLYNPNYVGVYCCIMIPLLLVLTFTMNKKRQIIPYLLLAVMVQICMIGSYSKTALLAIIPCTIFMAVYFGKRHWKKMIPVFLIYIVIFAAINIYQTNFSSFKAAMDKLSSGYLPNKEYKLTDITLNDEDFVIKYNNETAHIKYVMAEDESWSVQAADEKGKPIATDFNSSQDGYILKDHRFKGLEFIFGSDERYHAGFSVTSDKNSFFIYYNTEKKTYFYVNIYGKDTKIYSAETWDLPVFHLFGGFSGRGYIWSKSLPLLKDTLVLGSGPDTYAFMFPQYDYVSLVQNGWMKTLITKPHCLYLQIGIQTGVLSLIAFLTFYLWYFVQSFRLYWKRTLTTYPERCGAAIFMSSVCFMIAGLVNDSTVGVSIIYWTLLGIGFACNRMVKNTETEVTVNKK